MKKYIIHILFIWFAVNILFNARAFAQNPVRLPELSFKRLLNELQIIVATTPGLGEQMSIGLVVRYGSAFDPVDESGLANLVCRTLLRATVDKTLQDIQNELNYLGATIEVSCNWDGFRFLLRGKSATFERSLLILYQVVGEAAFNQADFDAAKQDILQQLSKPPDPRRQIHTQFEEVLFGKTTYGRLLEGSPETLKNVALGDVRYFYRKYFSPGSASLVIVGDVPEYQVLQKATRIWGVWVRQDEVPFTFVPPRQPEGRNIYLNDDPTSPAAQFIMGNLFPSRENPAYYPAVMASRILQQRLTKLLPTSLVTVGIEGRRMSGPFYIQGQAAADQAAGEIKKIQEVVEEMKSSPVSAEELAAVQNEWVSEFGRALSSTEGICNIILDTELYRLGTNYLAVFPDLIHRYDEEAIRQAAADWILPAGINILVRGPAAILKPVLEPLGSLQPFTP